MLAQRNPQEAYRRVDFDARIAAAKPGELVVLCLEQFVTATGSALIAHDRKNNELKSKSMTRALSSLTALQMGIDGDGGMAGPLSQFYGAARQTLLDNVLRFDPAAVKVVRDDFLDIYQAFASAGRSS